MNHEEQHAAMKMALAALDRLLPNVELARGLLREVVGSTEEATAVPSTDAAAESYAKFAARIDVSTKHVRTLARQGRIAIVGEGRAVRVLVGESIGMLRGAPPKHSAKEHEDEVANEGAEYVRRRSQLRVVGGQS